MFFDFAKYSLIIRKSKDKILNTYYYVLGITCGYAHFMGLPEGFTVHSLCRSGGNLGIGWV